MKPDDAYMSEPEGPGFTLQFSPFQPGQRVGHGRFRLTRQIGRGGMGVVWEAEDSRLALSVALKFLPGALAADPVGLEALRGESRRAVKLSHPNIVRIHDLHEWPGEDVFIAMELVRGPTLAVLRSRPPARFLDWEVLAPWVAQLCDALSHAHEEGVLHRDLKPANLMLDDRERLKLADFGVSCVLTETLVRQTGSRLVSGTLVYMSPQQLDGAVPRVTDDLYAVGATLYELLTGLPPFHQGDIAHQIRTVAPAPISQSHPATALGSQLPAQIEDVILSCLAKDPHARPSSALDLAHRLGLTTKHPRSTAPRRSSRAQGWSPVRRIRRASMIAGISLAALAVAWPLLRRPQSTDRQFPNAAATAPRSPMHGRPWTNTLGMRFVPVGDILFSTWETRIRDFDAYVRSTADRTERTMESLSKNGPGAYGLSWSNPGYPLTPEHPVVGMRWNDATGFCQWLTEAEQRLGWLTPAQRYRPPTDEEWSLAVGEEETQFPWGNELPPPPGAGNYAGSEVQADLDRPLPPSRLRLENHRDSYLRTAPVGSFAPNQAGLHDLGGNVQEWCASSQPSARPLGIVRGGSWDSGTEEELQSSWRLNVPLGYRSDTFGFRCVLELSQAGYGSPSPPAAPPTEPTGATFTNHLGLPFIPIAGVRFAQFETRVSDFAAFVQATEYDAVTEDRRFGANAWLAEGRTWKSPGFHQTTHHPVVMVHADDAAAFCAWLTTEERRSGLLGQSQRYRLPTDEEWTEASNGRHWKYPWGNEDTPPPGTGNYALTGSAEDPWPETAPVASGRPNPFGLYDLGGNAAEWCAGRRGQPSAIAARGGSWQSLHPDHLQSSRRFLGNFRSPTTGFRCVLEGDFPKR